MPIERPYDYVNVYELVEGGPQPVWMPVLHVWTDHPLLLDVHMRELMDRYESPRFLVELDSKPAAPKGAAQ